MCPRPVTLGGRRGDTRRPKLDTKENYFLDLAAEEEWPKDKLRDKISAIRTERHTITRSLEQAENQLDDGIQFLTLALELMTDPHAMYQTGSEAVRTIMNRSIFTKLYVDGDTIVEHELREPFNVLAEAYSVWQGYPHQTDTTPRTHPSRATGPHTALPPQHSSAAPQTKHGATHDHTASPALALLAKGSSKTHMVDLVGRYSNRSDLLEQLGRTWLIVSQSRNKSADTAAGRESERVARSRRLRDRSSQRTTFKS